MKLRYLLLIIFGLVTAVPLVLFWVWPHSQSMTDELNDVRDRHLVIAETLSVSLKHYHQDVITTFGLVADNLVAHGAVEGAEPRLQELSFRNVCVFDPASRRIGLTIDRFETRCPETLSPESFDFYRALASTGGLSPVMAGAEGMPTIYVATMTEGLLAVGALSTDFFTELGESIAFGQKGHAIIVDQSGRLLAHPSIESQRQRTSIVAAEPVQRILRGEEGIAIFQAPVMKNEVVAAFTAVEGTGWGVMVVQPVDELRDRAAHVSRSALIVVAAGVLVALVLSLLVAFYMTRPLRAVSQAARRMAAGNAEARTPVSQGALVPEEIRDLQTSFNVMAEAMERSKRDEQEARLRAEEANRSKSAFLANMSHELRTPLNAVLGFSEVILAETFGKIGPPRYQEYMEDIRASAHHLLDLINDLLDLSRIEAGAVKLNEAWIPIADILEDSAAMFREACTAGGLEFSVECRAQGRAILADSRALRQVLINLLSNAVRHTPAGGRIVVGAAPTEEGALDIFVTDTGAGIPPGDLQRVLQPFEQVARDQSQPQEGTGLGLSIVKQLVELHGGELNLESSVGEGTTVTFRLPPERVQQDEACGEARTG